MNGHWHFPALAAAGAFLALRFQMLTIIIIFIIWLFALLYLKRLGKLPLAVTLFALLFFYFYLPSATPPSLTSTQKTAATLMGKIKGPADFQQKFTSFTLQEQTTNKQIKVISFLTKKNQHAFASKSTYLKRGANCNVKGNLEMITPATNPGEFDFQRFSVEKGIDYQLVVANAADISCNGSSFMHVFDGWRTALVKAADKSYSKTTASWLKALVLGDDSSISDDVLTMFRNWSLSHLLAISGLHVGLIMGFIYFLLIKTKMVTIETAKWFVVIFLPFYSVIAGAQPSVIRACLMGLLLILFSFFSKKMTISDILSIVFLLLICIDGYIVANVGFQLSFLVTFSLILSRKWLKNTDSHFYQILYISFVSQMVILPIQLLYFSSFQPLSIMLNVLVVPYFSFFVIPLMFALLLLAPFGPYLYWLDLIFQSLHSWFLDIMAHIDQIMSFPWIYGEFPGWALFLYYTLLLFMFVCLQNGKAKKAFLTATVLTCLIMVVLSRPYISRYGELTMLDIGQGDAFVLELPHRKGVFFIDAGSTFSFDTQRANDNVYRQIIKPYLQKKGITAIDGIFISHEDIDHMGSVDFITADLRVKRIITSPYYPLNKSQVDIWKEQGTSIVQIGHGSKIRIEGQDFFVMSPQQETDSANENSLVLWTEFGGKSWLFTGDIGKTTERKMINTYPSLAADVLKVGHHGSKNSSDQEFIDHIDPQFALISAGRQNRYGHPHQEVLDILEENQVIALRTDQRGAVIFKFKQNEGTFYSHIP